MLTLLRFLMLLAAVVWIGGIVYFASVVAPAAFGVLPTRHLAGAIVTRTLAALHWIGIGSGLLFLAASFAHSALARKTLEPLAARHLLVYGMLLLTLFAHFGIAAQMQTLRAEMGEIDRIAPEDARRVQFNRLHAWSTRVEGGVLLLGLALLWTLARRSSQ